MSRSKKIFVLIAVIFILLLLYVSYDFSTRTTFPGSHKNSGGQSAPTARDSLDDSLKTDTLR